MINNNNSQEEQYFYQNVEEVFFSPQDAFEESNEPNEQESLILVPNSLGFGNKIKRKQK